jgi:hypothetical protein
MMLEGFMEPWFLGKTIEEAKAALGSMHPWASA